MTGRPIPNHRTATHAAAVAITRALEAHPHMEMVACPAHGTEHLGNPAGAATLAWTDIFDRVHNQRVTRWLRFDRAGIRPGTIVTVELVAQQRLDPRLPTSYGSCSILVTHDPSDTCEYAIGDPSNPYAWVFGLLCVGAILA